MELFCSYSWLQELTGTKRSPDEVAALLSVHGPTVDRVQDWRARFEHIVVGRIVDVAAHPNADKLSVVKVAVGAKKVQIVCGGSNLVVNQLVVVALPGARVRWHGEGEPIVLEEARIRGESSYGMICGASEIGLEKWFPHDEREIMDVTWTHADAGEPLSRALNLDDVVFEMEVTSNRPDLMGMEGIAREVCAVEGRTFALPSTPSIRAGAEPFSVEVRDREACPRYQAVVVDGVRIGPSPAWMQAALFKAGIKPINIIVDISNYVMLEQGQPLHAFDGERVERIVVRRAHAGEAFVGLDGRAYELDASMLVIADGERPIAVAGVMGGRETGISDLTNRVVWEAANFDPVVVRETSRTLLLFSESQSRFDKGLSMFATQRALERAVQLTLELAGGTVVSGVVDTMQEDYVHKVYELNPHDIERLSGFEMPIEEARGSLERLGFRVAGTRVMKVSVPFWRDHDIESPRDLIEEIVRMYGYARIPGTIPEGVSSVPTHPVFGAVRRVSDYLVGKGFLEMINYSMIGADDIMRMSDDVEDYVRVANPLSADHEYVRVSMLSSALSSVARNESIRPRGRMFEIANLFDVAEGDIPVETLYVMCVMWDMSPERPLFYGLKGMMSGLVEAEYSHEEFDNLHPGRSALAHVHGRELGVIGEVHPHTLKQFGVDARVAVCQFSVEALCETFAARRSFQAIPEFPGVKRDVAFFVDAHALYRDVAATIRSAHSLIVEADLFDVYEGEGVPDGMKSMAFHITYRDVTKTLSMEEADAAHAALEATLKKIGAQVRK